MNPKDFLINAWIAFGTLGGVVSLASLFDGVVAWVQFIADIIFAYRSLIDSLWGPLLGLFPIHAPRWTHDYLTLCSLSAVAVLWSLNRTAKELSFGQISSTFSAIWRMFFDFSVARSTLANFAARANDEARLGISVTKDIARVIAQISRLEQPFIWSFWNLLWILVLICMVLGAPYGIPFLMSARDKLDIERGRKMFDVRRTELLASGLPPEKSERLTKIFDEQAKSFLDFEHINELYYRTVIRHQLWYYAAVLVIFLLLVFVNYSWIRISAL